ncbi:MAG: acyltransferase, partial [Marmoricola sp.]|nr:acyltransferase [Marmoricola sp.]
ATSPLLHYWSLSVEEQFYLVWPAVLLIAMLVAPRVHLKARTALYAVLAIVTLASFSFSMWDSVANPTVAYYSTFDRVWEFGIGALLATARLWWVRMPSRLALGLSWVGGLGLIVAIFTLTYGHAFPAPWGLPVVLLTGLVMIGGHGRSTEKLWILDNPVMVYVGDISYSLYLWHLPVNVFLLGYIAHSSPWYYVTAIGVSLALAVVSYHFVERPLRYAPVLMTRRERDFFANRPRRPGIGRGFAILTTTCVAALAVVVSLSGVLSGPGDTSDQPALASTQQLSTPTTAAGPTQTPLTAQQHRVAAALGASHYPHFTPPLSALGSDRWLRDITSSACILDAGRETGTCGFAGSGGAKSALLVGDSFAAAWSPGVRAALQPRGWSVGVMSSPWCPTFTLPSYVDNGGQPNPTCGVLHSQLLRTVRERHPGMVILASSSAEVKNAERKELHTTPTALAHDGLSQTIRDLKAAGAGKVVVLGPPPQLGDLTHCVTRFGSPHDCVARPDQNFRDDVAAERRAAGERGAQYVATQDWFCFQDLCPAFVGRTPVTVDGYHLTMQDSRALAPLLRPALLGG